jgi:tetratricopeptide (TPR) repeat protein
MIVLDEENMLPRCLKSVQDVADELIVVDTGSKDNTISIAEDFDAKVYHFKWCDDFAAARNESLKHATGDWILQIDADEELLSSSILPLRKAILNPWCLIYIITCDNGAASGSERFVEVGRLFRNHPLVRYSRPYHETVSSIAYKLISQKPGWQLLHEPRIVIRHYGYEFSEIESRKKYERGLRIMESYVKENRGDVYMLTKLGETYNCVGRYDEAIVKFKEAIAINPNLADTRKDLGLAYFEKGMFDEAVVEFKEAIAINPNLADSHNNLGMACYAKGLLDKAISEYIEAIAIEPDFAEAHYNLGVAYGARRDIVDEEISEYKKALAINPNLGEAHSNLGGAYADKGMLNEAIVEYTKALAINPKLAHTHFCLAITYYAKKMYKLAIQHCDEAEKLGCEVPPWFLLKLKDHR